MSQEIDLKHVLAMIKSNDTSRMSRLNSLYGDYVPYEERVILANDRVCDALGAVQIILKYLIAKEEKPDEL